MKQKLLELLNAKFLGKGVRKDGLAQLAGSLAITVTTEEEAQALVEKLTDEQVTDFVKDYRKEVDKEVSTSTKTYESSLKQKYDFVERKQEEPNPTAGTEAGKPSEMPEWAKAIIETNKSLAEQLQAFKGAETAKTRYQKLEDSLKDAPPIFRENTLKNFNRMKFESDDDFETYVTETTEDLAKYKQDTANEGLRKFGSPGAVTGDSKGKNMSSATQAYIDAKTGKSGNDLGGKEV